MASEALPKETVSLRPGMPPLPARMSQLRLDHRGYPVPYFVAWIDGKPDFRVMDGAKLPGAVKNRRCWICGEPLGRYMTFLIGPMCAINRTISEPPSHQECADFSARACPFLTLPKAARRETNIPGGTSEAAGDGLKRNPGVVLLWTTLSYRTFGDGRGGTLFRLGDPTGLAWIAEGRTATRAEVMESIESGLPSLRSLAEAQGEDAIQALAEYVERGMQLVPA